MIFKRLGRTNVEISAIGQGIGDRNPGKDSSNDLLNIEIIMLGIELGMTFIDTAEIYGLGHFEELIAGAIKGIRDKVFIATKVSPEHLSFNNVIKSAETSLKRLNTDYIDLYQIHWPNPMISLEETLGAMLKLQKDGKIRFIGVSNFSLKELIQANDILQGQIASIQVEYNLFDRTIEDDILPYCTENNITVIAYSPFDRGRIFKTQEFSKILLKIERKYNATCPQIALQWLLSHQEVIAIPKTLSANHLKENARIQDFCVSSEDINIINEGFRSNYLEIPVDRIKVDKIDSYKFIPTPQDLARSLKEGVKLKPIKVVKLNGDSDSYDYILEEGKVRYWAWVLAYEGKKPIPALIR